MAESTGVYGMQVGPIYQSTVTYTYDGFGQRLIKTVSGSYGEIYQYGPDGILLEETDASGVPQADYIYLNGRPIATLNNTSGALYFLHDDRLGTPQLATDSSQSTAWQASYQPFGQASISGTVTQNLRLPGQYFDLETGWNHNGFRDYVPGLGRYIEPDPLGRLGSGNNLYVYVGDNPTNLIDPSGLADLNLFSPIVDPLGWGLANGWEPSGYYSVAGHGAVYPDGTPGWLIEGPEGQFYTPQQLADYIKKDPKWKNQKINLRMCDAGKGNNSFAQQLADLLGVTVHAPNDILRWAGEPVPGTNYYRTTGYSVANGGAFYDFDSRRR